MSTSASIVVLLTDFGLDDTYVGVMKGVILGLCPHARIIDLTHNISPHNIRQAALALLDSYAFFPERTVFLVVIDPGVGSERRPLAVQAGDYCFVAPDNGVLSYVLAQLPAAQSVELVNPDFQLPFRSRTFHGRDVFAPAAARLAAGLAIISLGKPVSDLVSLPPPLLVRSVDGISGEVLYSDRFGNIITSIGKLVWESDSSLSLTGRFDSSLTLRINAESASITIQDCTLRGVRPTYSAAHPGDILALVGSSGWLEIAVNQGSAAQKLSATPGTLIRLMENKS
ncbi:MAG: SAM hydrolase/SAM-dependent halogenase family protein [Aggregatilineales bacterium]